MAVKRKRETKPLFNNATNLKELAGDFLDEHLKVDVTKLCEHYGIVIREKSLDDVHADCILGKNPAGTWEIYVNKKLRYHDKRACVAIMILKLFNDIDSIINERYGFKIFLGKLMECRV